MATKLWKIVRSQIFPCHLSIGGFLDPKNHLHARLHLAGSGILYCAGLIASRLCKLFIGYSFGLAVFGDSHDTWFTVF